MKDTKKIEQAASLEELFERLDRVIGGLEGEELLLKILLIYIRKHGTCEVL